MGIVTSMTMAEGRITWAVSSDKSKGPQDVPNGFQGSHCTVMQSIGLEDDNKVEIFEEDLLDCIFLHPHTNYMAKLRGRVIWNSFIHVGPIGFIILDQEGGIHPFNTIDSFVVVGNTFQGVTKAA